MAFEIKMKLLKDYNLTAIDIQTICNCTTNTVYKWLKGDSTTACKLMTYQVAEHLEVLPEHLRNNYLVK